MTTFILGSVLGTAMSEKKSSSNTKYNCFLCLEDYTSDFLEPFASSDNGFILCPNCEAMRATEDLYVEGYHG